VAAGDGGVPTLPGPSSVQCSMKTFALAVILLAAPLGLAPQTTPPAQTGTWTARLQDSWTRDTGERWVSFQLEQDTSRRFGMSIPLMELQGLGARDATGPQSPGWTSPGPVRFSVRRDAGEVDFEGTFTNGRGSGTYRFVPRADYVAAMASAGYRGLDAAALFRLTLHDVSRSFVSSIQSAGYQDAGLEDLVRMRIHGVDADYVRELREAGYARLSIEDLVRTRIHGATPQFIRSMRDLGFKDLRMNEAVQMRIHGVTADFVKELRGLGYNDLDVDDLVKMRIHGVTPGFIRELRELGYGGLSADRLVQFRIHGVTADFIRDTKAAGFKNLDAADLIDMSIHGRRWLAKR
jgi:hypothetical protein